MNSTKIDWINPKEGWQLTHTWNPLYGCPRGCYYCYARKIHELRRRAILLGDKKLPAQYRKPFHELQVFPDRFTQPDSITKFCNIFVVDMGDICYHTSENIRAVIDVCKRNPQHRFLFLTKRFGFYNNYTFPSNSWLGITLEEGKMTQMPGYEDFVQLNWPQKFISIEPLLGPFEGIDLSWAQWIIVGKKSGGPVDEYLPKANIRSIKHDNIYWKKSIQEYVSDVL